MIASTDLTRATWGADFKRVIRGAAALVGLYDDTSLGDAIGRGRNTIAGWWQGAKPEPGTLHELSLTLGLSPEEMYRWVYLGGDPPTLTPPAGERERVEQEARDWADSATPHRDDRSARRRG